MNDYLRDKVIEKGWHSLSEAELLTLLVAQSGARPAGDVAEDIIAKFGSLKGLANQPMEKLLEVRGCGEATAFRLGAAYEIANRFVKDWMKGVK